MGAKRPPVQSPVMPPGTGRPPNADDMTFGNIIHSTPEMIDAKRAKERRDLEDRLRAIGPDGDQQLKSNLQKSIFESTPGSRRYTAKKMAEAAQRRSDFAAGKEGATFDAKQYLANYKDLQEAFGGDEQKARQHYIDHGMKEGRIDTKSGFDAGEYLSNYKDLQEAFGDDRSKALEHYYTHGIKEGRSQKGGTNPRPRPGEGSFDAKQYLANYADLQKAFGDDEQKARQHYLEYGIKENRTDRNIGTKTPKTPEIPPDLDGRVYRGGSPGFYGPERPDLGGIRKEDLVGGGDNRVVVPNTPEDLKNRDSYKPEKKVIDKSPEARQKFLNSLTREELEQRSHQDRRPVGRRRRPPTYERPRPDESPIREIPIKKETKPEITREFDPRGDAPFRPDEAKMARDKFYETMFAKAENRKEQKSMRGEERKSRRRSMRSEQRMRDNERGEVNVGGEINVGR